MAAGKGGGRGKDATGYIYGRGRRREEEPVGFVDNGHGDNGEIRRDRSLLSLSLPLFLRPFFHIPEE